MHRLAIYDMDRTITRRPTYTPFLFHAARRLHPLRLLLAPLILPALGLYTLKIIDRARLKEWMQTLLLGRSIHPRNLSPVVDGFAARTVAGNVHADAVARLAADRAAGYRLVLATASYRLYAAPIARALGMDDVIATNTVTGLDTRVTARIDGENCYGPAKLRMVLAWMHDAGIARTDAYIRFYSDHASDAPVLDWADEAFATNPHAPLRELAARRGWEVLKWR